MEGPKTQLDFATPRRGPPVLRPPSPLAGQEKSTRLVLQRPLKTFFSSGWGKMVCIFDGGGSLTSAEVHLFSSYTGPMPSRPLQTIHGRSGRAYLSTIEPSSERGVHHHTAPNEQHLEEILYSVYATNTPGRSPLPPMCPLHLHPGPADRLTKTRRNSLPAKGPSHQTHQTQTQPPPTTSALPPETSPRAPLHTPRFGLQRTPPTNTHTQIHKTLKGPFPREAHPRPPPWTAGGSLSRIQTPLGILPRHSDSGPLHLPEGNVEA